MKDFEELEKMTLWDISANEGGLTMLVLSIHCFIMFLICIYVPLEYKLKHLIWRGY